MKATEKQEPQVQHEGPGLGMGFTYGQPPDTRDWKPCPECEVWVHGRDREVCPNCGYVFGQQGNSSVDA